MILEIKLMNGATRTVRLENTFPWSEVEKQSNGNRRLQNHEALALDICKEHGGAADYQLITESGKVLVRRKYGFISLKSKDRKKSKSEVEEIKQAKKTQKKKLKSSQWKILRFDS